jgi:hypothetical protein
MDDIESQAEPQAEPQAPDIPVDATQETVQPAFDTEVAPRGLANLVRIVSLVIGDAVVFVVFAFIGMKSHSENVTPSSLFIVAAPFALAWFVVSPFIGAYNRELHANPRVTLRRTAQSWLASWPLALIVRGLIDNQWPPLIFALITLVTNMILLLGWRSSYAWLRRNRKHR